MHHGSTTFSFGGVPAGSPGPLTDLDASANPNYPSASKGARYRVTVAGRVGGASGKVVEAGDTVEAIADNAGGTEASVGTSWIVMQANIAGMTAAGLTLITAADAAAQRTALGLGTIATQAASAVSITGGTATGLTSLGIRSTGAAFDLTLASDEALTAGRTLKFNVGDADRTLTVPATGTAALLGTANVFTAAQQVTLLALGTTPTAAFSLVNSTAAAAGAQQVSPGHIQSGRGWSTNSGGASMAVDFRTHVLPVQGAAAPTGQWVLGASINAGAYQNLLTLTTAGLLEFPLANSGISFNGAFNLYAASNTYLAVLTNLTAGYYAGVDKWYLSNGGTLSLASSGGLIISSTTASTGSADIGFARTSAGVGRISNGSSGRGTLDAAGYQVGGVAGASGTGTVISSITVTNGIITAITVA